MKYPSVYEHYSKLIPMAPQAWEQFEGSFTTQSFSKGDVFLTPGAPVNNFAIITKGIFRLSYVNSEGEECIKCFRHEHQLLSAYAEYIQRISSRTLITAIEDSEVIMVNFQEFERMAKSSPEWMGLKLKITEEHFIIKDKREYDFLMRTALERYEMLMAESPMIIARVPQYMVANYLGVTPVALSRILSNSKKKTNYAAAANLITKNDSQHLQTF